MKVLIADDEKYVRYGLKSMLKELYSYIDIKEARNGEELIEIAKKLFPTRRKQINLIKQIIDKNINSPLTSSCGRLFDAVAAKMRTNAERRAVSGLLRGSETAAVSAGLLLCGYGAASGLVWAKQVLGPFAEDGQVGELRPGEALLLRLLIVLCGLSLAVIGCWLRPLIRVVWTALARADSRASTSRCSR